MRLIRASLLASLAMLALPATSMAVDTPSTVSGTVAPELSLAVATPAAMAFSHGAPTASSSLVTVISTQASWTLSISDAAASNAGHMRKVGAASTVLANPLQWSTDGATFNNLSGSPATVKTGGLVDTANVTYKQTLASGENVAAGDVYNLVATYTVT
jgi:hypothetical protein